MRIDVDQLLQDRAEESANPPKPKSPPKPRRPPVKKEVEQLQPPSVPAKRKAQYPSDTPPQKKVKFKPSNSYAPAPSNSQPPLKMSITLKLGPRPTEPDAYPCCLCISMDRNGLLRVQDPPYRRREAVEATGSPKEWMAHEDCANIVPETWVDELDLPSGRKEKVVFGVDAIVKDRWNLVCFLFHLIIA